MRRRSVAVPRVRVAPEGSRVGPGPRAAGGDMARPGRDLHGHSATWPLPTVASVLDSWCEPAYTAALREYQDQSS